MVGSEYLIIPKKGSEFTVLKKSPDLQEYAVNTAKNTCTCQDYQINSLRKRHYSCKHLKMVRGIINSKDGGEPDFEEEGLEDDDFQSDIETEDFL